MARGHERIIEYWVRRCVNPLRHQCLRAIILSIIYPIIDRRRVRPTRAPARPRLIDGSTGGVYDRIDHSLCPSLVDKRLSIKTWTFGASAVNGRTPDGKGCPTLIIMRGVQQWHFETRRMYKRLHCGLSCTEVLRTRPRSAGPRSLAFELSQGPTAEKNVEQEHWRVNEARLPCRGTRWQVRTVNNTQSSTGNTYDPKQK